MMKNFIIEKAANLRAAFFYCNTIGFYKLNYFLSHLMAAGSLLSFIALYFSSVAAKLL